MKVLINKYITAIKEAYQNINKKQIQVKKDIENIESLIKYYSKKFENFTVLQESLSTCYDYFPVTIRCSIVEEFRHYINDSIVFENEEGCMNFDGYLSMCKDKCKSNLKIMKGHYKNHNYDMVIVLYEKLIDKLNDCGKSFMNMKYE